MFSRPVLRINVGDEHLIAFDFTVKIASLFQMLSIDINLLKPWVNYLLLKYILKGRQ